MYNNVHALSALQDDYLSLHANRTTVTHILLY